MILLMGAIVVGLVVAVTPVWPHSRGWPWWPSLLLLLVVVVVAGLLAIERIEAADDYQGKPFDTATSNRSSSLGMR